jgi:hypothetical protein
MTEKYMNTVEEFENIHVKIYFRKDETPLGLETETETSFNAVRRRTLFFGAQTSIVSCQLGKRGDKYPVFKLEINDPGRNNNEKFTFKYSQWDTDSLIFPVLRPLKCPRKNVLILKMNHVGRILPVELKLNENSGFVVVKPVELYMCFETFEKKYRFERYHNLARSSLRDWNTRGATNNEDIIESELKEERQKQVVADSKRYNALVPRPDVLVSEGLAQELEWITYYLEYGENAPPTDKAPHGSGYTPMAWIALNHFFKDHYAVPKDHESRLKLNQMKQAIELELTEQAEQTEQTSTGDHSITSGGYHKKKYTRKRRSKKRRTKKKRTKKRRSKKKRTRRTTRRR